MLYAEGQISNLLLACHVIDEWTSLQGRSGLDLFSGVDSMRGQAQTWLEDCDLAVGWMQDLDGRLSETLKSIGAREVIVKSPFSAELQAIHQRDRFLEVIKEAPFSDEGDVVLTVTEPLTRLGLACLEAAGLSIGRPLVIIHPGSGSAHKCVAPEPLALVVTAIQMSGATPVILEGPADRGPVEHLLQSCVSPPIVLKGEDILTVVGVLSQACLFVGQDSGVTHMAGLIGVRTVALFGPTNPARWAPCGTHVTVVQGTPCLCQSWDDVSRCENKPCLKMPQDDLVALCLAYLRESAIRQRIPSDCLVTDYPVC
jgi:ADP-heptose:LPS heptosyltransferase